MVVSAPTLARERLKEVRQQGEECLREARQAVWNLRSLESGDGDLAGKLRDSVERLTAGMQIRSRFSIEGERRGVSVELQEHLLRIGREAIINAVRHSQASELEVRILFREGFVSLAVADNGRGFDMSSAAGLTGHYGLTTIRERAEGIGGRLNLVSAPGRGTSIEVVVKLEG
jgi:signal transduction histidine kinase